MAKVAVVVAVAVEVAVAEVDEVAIIVGVTEAVAEVVDVADLHLGCGKLAITFAGQSASHPKHALFF